MRRQYGRRADDLKVVRLRWSCGDLVDHVHRWRWSAWACNKRQWLIQVLKELWR